MTARQRSCCFTGHRPTKLPWRYQEQDVRCLKLKARIADTIEAVYADGYRHFLCGMAQGCDLYFCEAVIAFREKHPDVTIEAVIPCPTQADRWSENERLRYAALVEACDTETLVSAQYSSGCMQRRDRYMVDHAQLVIAVYNGEPKGGTAQTLAYALRNRRDTCILEPEEELL